MARPTFKPTQEHREIVAKLAAVGTPHSDICLEIKDAKGKHISEPTMRKYFSVELRTSKLKANFNIAGALYRKALSGDVTSMIFWLKCQAGWKDTQRVELTGANGAPVQSITAITTDPIEAAKIYQQMMNV